MAVGFAPLRALAVAAGRVVERAARHHEQRAAHHDVVVHDVAERRVVARPTSAAPRAAGVAPSEGGVAFDVSAPTQRRAQARHPLNDSAAPPGRRPGAAEQAAELFTRDYRIIQSGPSL